MMIRIITIFVGYNNYKYEKNNCGNPYQEGLPKGKK